MYSTPVLRKTCWHWAHLFFFHYIIIFQTNDTMNDQDAEKDQGENATNDEEEELENLPAPKFSVREKVLARDKDGLLYEAAVRRSMWGTKQHSQALVGMDSLNEIEEQAMSDPTWHYFVHYNGWKPCWDRWVSEDAILDITPANQDLAKRISQEHKNLQKDFKSNKKRKIDGGEFLKAWKIKLTNIMGDGSEKKEIGSQNDSKKSLTLTAMDKDFKLRAKQSMTSQKGGIFAQQMVLSFGLKRILVEEWEIVNQFNMVHQLPATVTVQQALEMYLESKGIENKNLKSLSDETKDDEVNEEHHTEWREMVEGIALLFEQALPFRLLYPSEQSQLLVLENMEQHEDSPKAELYGCEFLVRLFCDLPAIMAENFDTEEVKPMIAKVNDIIRFFQKNQSRLFSPTPYRIKNDDELRLEQKIAKRQERKRKLAIPQSEASSSFLECSKVE